MAKKTNKAAKTEVSDYSMQTEFSRTKLPTGEYSDIPPKDLTQLGDTPTVKYPLGRAGSPCPPPDLSAEFAERDPDLDLQVMASLVENCHAAYAAKLADTCGEG